MSNEGRTWLRPEDPTQTLHQTEEAIHQQKLLANASIVAIHRAAAEQGQLDDAHDLVIAMRDEHAQLRKLRLERNWLRHRSSEANRDYGSREQLVKRLGYSTVYGFSSPWQDHQIGGNPI